MNSARPQRIRGHDDPAGSYLCHQAFQRFSHNPYEQAAPMYLMGHPENLIPRFQARIDAGVEELTFNLMVPDPKQLDIFARDIRPHLHR